MSATGRGSARQKDDFYATPSWCTWLIARRLGTRRSLVVDAGCGEGAIFLACAKMWPDTKWIGIDIDKARLAKARDAAKENGVRLSTVEADFVSERDMLVFTHPPDAVIMNPPFSLAEQFVRAGLEHAPEVIALLRLGWLASAKRCRWLRGTTPDVYVLPNRPSFTGRGSDSADYAWMVFKTNRTVAPRLEIMLDLSVDARHGRTCST